MNLEILTPVKSLSKPHRKHAPGESRLANFVLQLKTLIGGIDETESEGYNENLIKTFLEDSFYKTTNQINKKDRQDLAIYSGQDNNSNVDVILEVKKPNSSEMISAAKPNNKALQQLILYFLRERIDGKNTDIKNLVATDIYNWFIFDANVFEKAFYQPKLIKQYKDWRDNKKVSADTGLFYKEIAKPLIEDLETLECTHINLKDYENLLDNADEQSLKQLTALYKIISPKFLIKESFADDSNKLDKNFYNELLHIIGLEEIKEKNKLLIDRKAVGKRDAGSLLELAIAKIETEYSLYPHEKIKDLGDTRDERIFAIALELCITWINRILFLKLLEAQLVNYHKGDKHFRFLNVKTIDRFNELYKLFHDVLACKLDERRNDIAEKYFRIPYLNSSLFDFADIERLTIRINSIDDNRELAFIDKTILKDEKKSGNNLTTLEYLFKFLDKYDFATVETKIVREDDRPLINASVLGKVFEKINGYKDGAIFTPAFITMYMCRQAIRLAVVQKFKDAGDFDSDEFDDLKNYVRRFYKRDDIKRFNEIIDSIKLCDPAVGSGHFLVSSLNEIIAVKSELGIFADADGETFPEYDISIVDDELFITDRNGDVFKYEITNGTPNANAQKLQKTLFHEKQKLIENCLFGVDINPNSVKICRLRLWIELLKNAYYRPEENYTDLETLPNIDINIKEGNSLISRFALDEDLSEVLKQVDFTVEDYRGFVKGYKETRDREAKREFEAKIRAIKEDFKVKLYFYSDERRQLKDFKDKRTAEQQKTFLIADDAKEKKRLANIEKYTKEIAKQEETIKQIEENRIYQNAFEWRFEFPEVLDNDGKFLGFDIVIGNPPYIGANELATKHPKFREHLSTQKKFKTLYQKWDIYIPFIELSIDILKQGLCGLIIPFPFINQMYPKLSRNFVIEENTLIEICDLSNINIFEGVTVNNCIIFVKKEEKPDYSITISGIEDEQISELHQIQNDVILNSNSIIELNSRLQLNLNKNEVNTLGEYCYISKGMVLNADEVNAKSQFVKADLISEIETDIFSRKYIEAKNIDSYKINKIRFLEWNTKRVPSLVSRPTFQELYANKKILINKIGNLKATYDEDNLVCDQTIRIAVLWKDLSAVQNRSISNSIKRYSSFTREKLEEYSNQINLRFILAILNSKLGNYLLDSIRGLGNIDVNPEYLKNLPIPKISPEAQEPFIKLVDEILEKKKGDEETKDLEDEIDKMVYQLYDLTPDEIDIVEGKAR